MLTCQYQNIGYLNLVRIVLYFLLGMSAGCSTLPRNPVPLDQISDAEIPGVPDARVSSGVFSEALETDLLLSLQQAFTTIGAKDILIVRWVSFLWNDAFADSTPLAKLIKRYITKDVLQAIAAAPRQ